MGAASAVTPAVASIGTTDPWNAAGLGLDIRVLEAFGVRPYSVVAAVSAQDRRGLARVAAIDASLVSAQLAALADAPPAAYRIGALADAATVGAVAEHVAGARVPVVLDPVLGASAGGIFGDDAMRTALVRRLLPHVTLVVPNVAEARELVRIATGAVPGADTAAADLARALTAFGAKAALVTDGDREPEVRDVLLDERGVVTFADARLPGGMRGTGCMLAAGIAAGLARGTPLRVAIADARAFVRVQIAGAEETGGMRLFAVGDRCRPPECDAKTTPGL